MTSNEGIALKQHLKEAFYLQTTLLQPNVPVAYLDMCKPILQKRHLEEVFEERAVALLCGYPACANAIKPPRGKYRISLSKKRMYDAKQEQQFCGSDCLKKGLTYVSRLNEAPPQLRPPLVDIFGTNEPNPADFVFPTSKPVPNTTHVSTDESKMVWAKNHGVVKEHRTNELPVQLEEQLNNLVITEKKSDLKQQVGPFPDAGKAVLIEGFALPSHKQKLAKKLEKAAQNEVPLDNIVDSDTEGEDEDDFSDSDSEDGDTIVDVKQLPLFANLWRRLSEMITLNTQGWIKHHFEGTGCLPEPQLMDKDTSTRFQLFCHCLERQVPQVAKQLHMSADRGIYKDFSSIVHTFDFREAVDPGASKEWPILTTVLLLVIHHYDADKLNTFDDNKLESILRNTGLTKHELGMLVGVLTDCLTDTAPVVDEPVLVVREPQEESVSCETTDNKQCRKCRRRKVACTCSQN